MFDFAWSHYALLLIIAVVLLGPQEIPTVLRFIGRWTGRLRRLTGEWREYIEHIAQEDTARKNEDKNNQTVSKPDDSTRI